MAQRTANIDKAFPTQAFTATTQSSSFAAPGAAIHVVGYFHATAVTGTTPTLVVSFEQSPDQTTWTAIAGSSSATLTAAGNVTCNCIATDDYVRMVLTLGGTSPSFTGTASVLIASE